MSDTLPPHDWAELARAFDTLLIADPTPSIGVLRPNGLLGEIPAGFAERIVGHDLITGRSIADYVQPADRPALIDAWIESATTGIATVEVTMTNDTVGRLTMIDLRGVHGVICIALQGDRSGAEPGSAAGLEPVPPRYAKTKRDALGRVLEESAQLNAMLQMSPEQYVGVPGKDLIHPEDYPRVIDVWTEVLANPQGTQRWRGRYRRSDGSYLWTESTITNELAENGYIVSELIDISAEMAMHDSLQQRERLLAQLTDAFPLGILQLAAGGAIEHSNHQARQMLGDDATSLDAIAEQVDASDQPAFLTAVSAALQDCQGSSVEVAMCLPGGVDTRYRRFEFRPLSVDDGEPHHRSVVASIVDTTEVVLLQRELRQLATLDSLTGCHNRAAILAALQRALHGNPASGTGLIFLDLDGFKGINDTHGHTNGDALLATVARRMLDEVHGNQTVGRFGGDEFLVVVPDISDPAPAMDLAHRLIEAIAGPVPLPVDTLRLGTSAGVAWTPNGVTSSDELVQLADQAMYRSKRARTGRPVLLTPTG